MNRYKIQETPQGGYSLYYLDETIDDEPTYRLIPGTIQYNSIEEARIALDKARNPKVEYYN